MSDTLIAPAVRLPIAMSDVNAAAARIKGQAVRTPLLSNSVLDEVTGGKVLFKPECLQRTGSFKFRGAYNRLAALGEEGRRKGVVAASSGNHAQGVAEEARIFGISATIVMPTDAPAIKRLRTERSGATVVPYDRAKEDRLAIANEIAERTGAVFVPPYDDPFVMAGQGTAGLEIAEDLERMNARADRVLVPTGGGGLLSGISTAVSALMPSAVCQPVEPEDFDDTNRSLSSGERVSNERRTGSIADALLSVSPGTLTFTVNRERARPGFSVSDADMLRAVAFAANELKLVVEPGGAAALAALLAGSAKVRGEVVVCVLSGGNIDPPMLAEALSLATA
ncbi:MAG: threonine/serine dehydratase [Pseudomonadota bacterium]